MTVIFAVPLARLVVGVKVADLVSPDPLSIPNVPPVTTKSPAVPSQAKLEPGSSVKVKVMAAVSPIFKVETLEVIVTLGASVSIEIDGDVPAEPVFPAESM